VHVQYDAANVESLELEDGEEEDLVLRFACLIIQMNQTVLKLLAAKLCINNCFKNFSLSNFSINSPRY